MKQLLRTYALATAAWAVAWQLAGDANGWLALLNAWSFWLLSTGTAAGVLAWLPQRPGAATLLGLVGGSLLARRTPWMVAHLNGRQAVPTSTPERTATFSVLSMNLLHRERSVAPVIRLIQERRPTLALFQEAIPTLAGPLDQALAAAYPYRHWVPDPVRNMGLGVISQVPFAVTGFWQHPDFEAHALRVTLSLAALGYTPPTPDAPQELDVYTVQFVSPANDVRIHGPTRLLHIREAQIRQILDAVRSRGRPALVAGDWNTTAGTRAYRMAARELQDAWLQAGRGPGWTWPVSANPFQDLPFPPLLRLDHLFHTGHTYTPALHATAMEVIRRPLGSDHAPIWAELTLLPSFG